MRFLETLLLFCELLTFLLLVLPRFRASRWTRYAALAAVLIAAAQILIEGARWQMVPAFALSAVFLLVSLLPHQMLTNKETSRPVVRRLVTAMLVGLGGIALAFASALPVAIPVFSLPRPSGPYGIGTLTYHSVDQNREELFTAAKGDRRELMVQVWYPAEMSQKGKRAPYLPANSDLSTIAGFLKLPSYFFSHMRYVRTHAVEAAAVARAKAQYPVLIFAPGRSGFRQHNTSQVEELVSHGYIVATIDQPYVGSDVVFPDGRRISFDNRLTDRKFADHLFAYLGRDAITALNKLAALNKADPNGILAGRLDLGHVGAFGASLGGIIAAEACRLDQRFDACLALDVFMPPDIVEAGLRQPMMWISTDAETMRRQYWPAAEISEHQSSMRAAFERVRTDGYLILVPGMFHVNISDFPFFIAEPLAHASGFVGPIDHRRAHAVINSYSLAFFDKYLRGKPAPLLDSAPKRFPEIHFEARRH